VNAERQASILIVDDNISQCKTISFVLGSKGYAVNIANDGPDAVVMMMTAYAVEDLVREALEEGANGVFYKPLDIEKVIAVIERVRKAKKGAFILLVDDDPETCDTFKSALSKKSYRMGIAHIGEEAIATVKERIYDIIFIDMKLPTINGLETYLAVKEINPEAVVVVMTANRREMNDQVEEALNNQAYTCLNKPLDMQEVMKMIAEILQRKQML